MHQTHTQIITPLDAEMSRYEQSVSKAMTASIQLLIESDVRLAARGGTPGGGDPFLFDAREQAIADAIQDSAQNEFHPRGEYSQHPAVLELLMNQQTLHDLLESESVRLSRERNFIARSSIDTLPAVLTYLDEGRAEDPDTLLAWRLQIVKSELKPNILSQFERDELQSILANLNRRGPKTQSELVGSGKTPGILKMLETLPVSPFPLRTEEEIKLELGSFLIDTTRRANGLPDSLDGMQPFFEKTEATLRTQVETAFTVLSKQAQDDVRKRAAQAIAKPMVCLGATHAQTARQMAPPDERARACSLVRLLSISQSDTDEITALLALHEAVVTAGRALSMHDKVRDPQVAAKKWPRMLALDADTEKRELFMSANHPTKALAGGIAAGVLLGGGPGHARARAREWMRYGDARFDVVERHLLLTVRSTH